MYSDCDIRAMTIMGIDTDHYLAVSDNERSLLLNQLRDAKLATVHDYELQIAQIDYLRSKLTSF
jgi:hypothetical protein